MRKTLTIAALVLALSCPTFPGVVHTPGVPDPEPSPTPTPTDTTQMLITTDEDATGVTTTDTLMPIVLAVVESVLSLL